MSEFKTKCKYFQVAARCFRNRAAGGTALLHVLTSSLSWFCSSTDCSVHGKWKCRYTGKKYGFVRAPNLPSAQLLLSKTSSYHRGVYNPRAFDQHKTPPEGLCSARDPRALTKQMIHKSGTSAGWQLGLFWHELKTKGSSQLFPPPVPTPSYIFSLLRSEATSLEGSVPLSKSLHTRRKIS